MKSNHFSSPLFFHILSDRDVDFINASGLWGSFAQDVSCIIGEDSKKIWAGDESSKPRDLDAESRLGHDRGVQINISPPQKLLLRSRSSVSFFMNVSSPSAPAMLPFQRPAQTNVYVRKHLNPGYLVISWIQKTKPNIPLIQSVRCQVIPTNRCGFAPRLLCMCLQGCTFAIPLCCWKNTPRKHVSWYGMVFQCIVTIFLV